MSPSVSGERLTGTCPSAQPSPCPEGKPAHPPAPPPSSSAQIPARTPALLRSPSRCFSSSKSARFSSSMMADAEIEVEQEEIAAAVAKKSEKAEQEIVAVAKKLEAVVKQLEAVAEQLEAHESSDHISYLKNKESKLQDEKIELIKGRSKLLDEEIELMKGKRLRDENIELRKGKRLREEENQSGSRAPERGQLPEDLQEFVSSAAANYKRWKQDYEQALESHKKAVEKVGEAADVKMHRPFLKVKVDPFGNYSGGNLLWVRKCYTDMKTSFRQLCLLTDSPFWGHPA